LSIFEKDLSSLSLGCLCCHFKETLKGYDYFLINQLKIRAWVQEHKFMKAKESCKAHQSNTRVDCESNTLEDEEKENNSNMHNNPVMLRNDSNKDFSESIASQETRPNIQKTYYKKHIRSNKD